VLYFPSYEIVMGSFARGAYFGDDLRSVTDDGVDHVMRTFFRRLGDEQEESRPVVQAVPTPSEMHLERMAQAARLNCDEEALDRGSEENRQPVVPRRRRQL
jgi:hypothetical protein